MAHLAVDAGYEVNGIPYYEDGRWLMNVRVLSCASHVQIGAPPTAQEVTPRSFTVLLVNGTKYQNLTPAIHPSPDNLSAQRLAEVFPDALVCSGER